jgi:hypothetical protein
MKNKLVLGLIAMLLVIPFGIATDWGLEEPQINKQLQLDNNEVPTSILGKTKYCDLEKKDCVISLVKPSKFKIGDTKYWTRPIRGTNQLRIKTSNNKEMIINIGEKLQLQNHLIEVELGRYKDKIILSKI